MKRLIVIVTAASLIFIIALILGFMIIASKISYPWDLDARNIWSDVYNFVFALAIFIFLMMAILNIIILLKEKFFIDEKIQVLVHGYPLLILLFITNFNMNNMIHLFLVPFFIFRDIF